ncbi:MAG TPA: DMT family transporter [Gaiellaceae bacterium]|nr:DMT family transporter [Gaiellaceae bacterium]
MTEIAFPHPAAPARARRRLAPVLVLLAATLFALNGSVSKVALQSSGLSTLRWTELRSTGAFLGLAAWLAVRDPRSVRVARAEVATLVAYGIFGFAFVQWLYFVAIDRLPIGVALLFEFSGIVLIALWARFVRREPVRARLWPALALVLAGLAFVAQAWQGLALDGVGLAASLAAAGSLALFYLQGERLVGGRPPLAVVCLGLLFASVFWALVQPWWSFPAGALGRSADLPGAWLGSVPVWLLALASVLLGTIAPFALSISALQHLSATAVGVIATFEPVAAAIVAWLWLGESLDAAQLAGGVVVLAGILLAETSR